MLLTKTFVKTLFIIEHDNDLKQALFIVIL